MRGFCFCCCPSCFCCCPSCCHPRRGSAFVLHLPLRFFLSSPKGICFCSRNPLIPEILRPKSLESIFCSQTSPVISTKQRSTKNPQGWGRGSPGVTASVVCPQGWIPPAGPATPGRRPTLQ